ncbi:iron complex outermembrane recepter protein [Soonwooa buanensis]|uniref:Iron complex outermembrane recepter protein n=1 Tax=Soonwooa buanensis TaxID=619805 RepID=A0A1T5EGL6_9FLAO|nr:TonB-dependent receptor plug domain-containing protein [Soonwooa buanensis]SKB83114.1 iron complex outermembrane recepter protein [Soonwooa buanensis]
MKGFIFLSALSIGAFSFAQSKQDTIKEIEQVRVFKKLPVSKEIINVQRDLDAKNLGQDLPILLKNQTSVISTSDAGNGVGYTGFRIRGVAGTSINVMMNGIPYNDSESQGTFFVNVPDLTSSASQIVIQRGVGTSTNGAAAFGASVNIVSKDPEKEFYVKTDDSYGSFNTYKYSAEIGSGKFWKDRLSLMGRYTKIHSDGYIDRAFSDLNSYSFAALFEEDKTRIRLMAFGGKEKTYQAWNGIDKAMYEKDRRYNYSGAIYDASWESIVGFYDNETDNYRQNHYQLLWEQTFNDHWNLETTLHYTKGKGYYENYKQDAKFSKYNLPNILVEGSEIKRSDFIRKKWLDNDFYGAVSTLYGKYENADINIGVVANQYYGRHFGNVSGVFFPEINEHEYYRNRTVKNEISGFVKGLYRISDFELFGDLQMRNVTYDAKNIQQGDGESFDLNKKWTFFNPKAGVNYRINGGKLFLSYAIANREPNRDDLQENPNTKNEFLQDWELGLEKQFGSVLSFSANLYYMQYKDQLVLSGVINDVGNFIRQNVDKSYRAGIELGALANVSKDFRVNANLSLSKNKIKEVNASKDDAVIIIKDAETSFSPSVIGNLGLQYDFGDAFTIGLTNQYVGKQYLDNTQNENYRIKDYFLTDFNAKFTLQLPRTTAEFKLLVNNVFDQKYINNGFVYGDTPYYYAQAGVNFMFGVSLKFK